MLPAWIPTTIARGAVALAAHGPMAFVALADGRVFRSDDGGARWAEGPRGPHGIHLLHALPRANPPAVLAATPGVLYQLSGGTRWQAAAGLDGQTVVAIASTPTASVAGTLRSGTFQFSEASGRWKPAGRGLPFDGRGLGVYALAVTGTGLFAAHDLGVSRSTDAGRTWEPASLGLPLRLGYATLAAAGQSVWATAGGRLYHSTTGMGWAEIGAGAGPERPVGLLAEVAGRLYATDRSAALIRSDDGGTTWTHFAVGGSRPTLTLVVASGRLLALGQDGTVWQYRSSAASRPATGGARPGSSS